MKKTRRFFASVNLLVIIIFASFFCIGPHLRSLVSEVKVSLDARPRIYDCAGESCIGFVVVSAAPAEFAGYQGKLLLPYSLTSNRDQLNNSWEHLLKNPSQSICLQGYLHRFSESTFRLFSPHPDSYSLRLLDYRESACSSPL